jgi:hypothetical protein
MQAGERRRRVVDELVALLERGVDVGWVNLRVMDGGRSQRLIKKLDIT